MSNTMRVKKTKFKNTRDTDIYIRDAYGKEHVIYPNKEKVLLMIKKVKEKVKKLNTKKSINLKILKQHIEFIKQMQLFSKSLQEKITGMLEDFAYLLHHIEITSAGKEEIHHCFVYDHIGNLFEQEHLLIKNGVAYVNGKKVKDGLLHIIKGLEPTQEVVWSDAEAKENKIRPKKIYAGMTLKKKAKEW